MGIAPGVFVVGNVTPGKEVSAFPDEQGGIEIHNDTAQPLAVVLKVQRPVQGGVLRWEKGYEEIPEAAWCRLAKDELEVPPKSVSKVRLFISVPDRPENYNRKWMAAVVCAPKPKAPVKGATGVGVQVASRVGIETLPKADVSGEGAGGLALVPSILGYEGCIPGETFAALMKIRNNDKKEHRLAAQGLEQAENDAERRTRYFRGGTTAVTAPSWLAPVQEFALGSGETKELKLSVTVPKNATAGQTYEEILFLKDDAGRYDFIRLRMRIAEGGGAPKDK